MGVDDGKLGQDPKGKTMNGDDIKALRERLAISQRELAQRIGVAKATVQFWEQGRGEPKRKTEKILESLE